MRHALPHPAAASRSLAGAARRFCRGPCSRGKLCFQYLIDPKSKGRFAQPITPLSYDCQKIVTHCKTAAFNKTEEKAGARQKSGSPKSPGWLCLLPSPSRSSWREGAPHASSCLPRGKEGLKKNRTPRKIPLSPSSFLPISGPPSPASFLFASRQLPRAFRAELVPARPLGGLY